MGFNYKFTSKADQDLDEIYEYYEDKQKGLGKRFIENVFSKVEATSTKPEKYSADEKGIRHTGVKGFKHHIIYYVFAAPIMLVIAVWHSARRPFNKKERLED